MELNAAKEEFDNAKKTGTDQILKLRRKAKEKDGLLKKAHDTTKAAGEESDEVKQLHGELAEKEKQKQKQLAESKLKAAEVARHYLRSKGLATSRECQTFKESHAQQAHHVPGAGEDDATDKRGSDGVDGGDNGEVADVRDPKRQQISSAKGDM